jgi:hypothetical protein
MTPLCRDLPGFCQRLMAPVLPESAVVIPVLLVKAV